MARNGKTRDLNWREKFSEIITLRKDLTVLTFMEHGVLWKPSEPIAVAYLAHGIQRHRLAPLWK
ncbi:hypothetical protein BSN85_14110 [Bradyrhizobium brasilense]|nr:hypothetical protein BSN85_14110 [Bradyrhizobium brasilense]